LPYTFLSFAPQGGTGGASCAVYRHAPGEVDMKKPPYGGQFNKGLFAFGVLCLVLGLLRLSGLSLRHIALCVQVIQTFHGADDVLFHCLLLSGYKKAPCIFCMVLLVVL